VKHSRYLFFLFVAISFFNGKVAAQVAADIDTFHVNNAMFIAQAPDKWFSTKVQSGIQPDTSWNYIAKYESVDGKVNAQLGIQITNNTTYTPTKKERRKFKKKCMVTETIVSGYDCFYLNYKPERIKKCNTCNPVYTRVYLIPLNSCQTMTAIFIGQGQKMNVDPLEIVFREFLEGFISGNEKGLSVFRQFDFEKGMMHDTLRVQDYYLTALVPTEYTISRHYTLNGAGYSVSKTNSCETFTINVQADICDTSSTTLKTVAFNPQDTGVVIINANSYSSAWAQPVWIRTKRTLPTNDGKFVILTISSRVSIYDSKMLEYYERLIREYANALQNANLKVGNSPPIIFGAPELNPRSKDDIRAPLKFEKTMPGAKPKK